MLGFEEILNVAKQTTTGGMPLEEANAIVQVNSGRAGLFKTGKLLNVTDTQGNPLIIGKKYKFPYKGDKLKTVLVTGEIFGAGNIACTYYRVTFYVGENMEEGFTVIDGKGSPFSGFCYPSRFQPINDEER